MGSPRVLLAGLGVVVLWASAFPAIRVAAPELGVAGLSLARLVVAAVALAVLAPMLKVRLPARRDLPLILACGFFGMAAYQVLLNWGELHVPAGTASIIVSAAPLVSVAIAAGVFGERLTVLKIVGSAIALSGVVLVAVARSGVTLSSAAWILVAAMVVQGAYHPLTKPLLKRYTGLEVATYGMIAGTVMLLPVLPFTLSQLVQADAAAWLAAIYLGLLPSALGFVLWGYAVARLPLVASTSLLYLVPPVAVLIAFIWLGELPLVAELVGGAVVIAGVVLMSLRFAKVGKTLLPVP
ncbi:DMT family transporter [Cryobacterium sp. PH31-L1]|uniref:DMT family transporter n=1 Tax=Cryobacterium sp. PH31-L1 TaxID=3046199 RepID=UPI0024BB01EF|nr:DMT family transporter [Cryobacterium sp. PH31-L1]MDJ0377447.1 DMT family transporter [Cryobacterium sp. PH31-L1]